ncbi:TPA: hypothetical protein DIT45_01055 [Candidatus Acetothermia bacterium]|nr:hypothetical protein [Candidatus Acetothermia bacterium]
MVVTLLTAALLSLAVTMVCALLILRAGRSWPLRAADDGRPIGGPVLLVGTLVGMIPIFCDLNPFLLAGAAVIVLVGLIDDQIDLSPWYKLLGQGIAATLAVFGLSSLHLISLGTTVYLGSAQRVVTFLWVVVLMNAVNLIDGLDGLAIATLLPPLTVLIIIASLLGNYVGAILAAAMLGALVGFYPFNRHRGRLLLGDTGAELLGYLLAILTLMILNRGPKGWSILPALFLVALPLSDTVFAVIRRIVRGQSIFQGDKRHIHHRLATRFGVRKAVAILAGTSIVSSGIAFLLWWAGG